MSMEMEIHDRLMRNQSFWDFKGQVDYIDEWFLMSTPAPMFLITIGYLLFVLKLGPDYMSTKPPKTLKNILPLYNLIQVGISSYLFYLGLTILGLPSRLLDLSCVVERKEGSEYIIHRAIYAYFFAKLSELADTIFFVLKKNYRQVTFLHLYHHVSMVWFTWLTLKYEPSQSTVFLGTLNSFVHIIMYSYYCLSAVPGLTKYLWWKKYITKMQITQFLIIIIHATADYCFSGCRPSYVLFSLILFNAVLFTCLFLQFYVSSYNKSKNMKLKE